MAENFPTGNAEEVARIDTPGKIPKNCEVRKFRGAPIGCCIADGGNLMASAKGVLMDFEPYMTWWIELVEEHELLQLHFAVVKHAHQLGAGARAANRRTWEATWELIPHNLSDWDEEQDTSANPETFLITENFIRGLGHSPRMLQARVIWFVRRKIAKNNPNSRGLRRRAHSHTPMFHQYYAGVERQCYWVWGEITSTRKAFLAGNTNPRLFRRPATLAQATQWEQTPVGKAGMKIEALMERFLNFWVSIVPTFAQEAEPEDDDDVEFVSEQQVNGFHTMKTESPDSPAETTDQVQSLLDRIADLESENTDLRAAHDEELASMSTRLENAERDASKFERNAIEADDESDGLHDKLSEAEQSIQGLRAELTQKDALAERFERQLRNIQGLQNLCQY